MHKEDSLDNGLRVVTRSMSSMESASIGIWVKAGCRYEKKEHNGISHVLEHLIFKGTERRDTETLKQEIEGRGGSFNGFTAEENTCYYVKVRGKHLAVAVDVLSDMMLHAVLKERDLAKEKQVIIEEINMYKDMPNQYIHELLQETLWPDQPLGAPLAGTVESVSAVTRDDVRSYRDTFYCANNMLLVGAGSITHSDMISLARRFLRTSKRGRTSAFPRSLKPKTKPRITVDCRKTEQVHLALGVHAPDRFHPDRYALSLLNIILGANMSSRLFREVREERALCYEIASSVRRFEDAGAFVVHAGIEPKKAVKALTVILKVLRHMKSAAVGKEELRRAKEYYKGQLLLSLEDTMSNMLWLGEKIIANEPDRHPDEILKKIERVQPDAIRHIAGSIFQDENLALALIGPIKDRRTLERIVHLS